MENNEYPSKKFIIRGGIAIAIVGIILIVQTNWFYRILHHTNKPPKATAQSLTLAGVTTKDSNGNGIPDWEETLWGLDPTKLYTNGKSNADIIKEKQQALGISADATADPTNQTDAIAEQLFSITTALSQNQTVDDTTLQNIASQLGSSVNVASVSNKYSLNMMHVIPTSSKDLIAYDKKVAAILNTADLSGDDIQIIVQAAQNGDYSQLPQLTPIGQTYDTLAKQLSVVPVPIGVAQDQLDLINGLSGMATSFTYLIQMQDNGTQALVGVALYKVYSSRAANALIDMHAYLTKYGILSS